MTIVWKPRAVRVLTDRLVCSRNRPKLLRTLTLVQTTTFEGHDFLPGGCLNNRVWASARLDRKDTFRGNPPLDQPLPPNK